MQDQDKLDCNQAAEMLDAFHDMELEMADVERVEAHLADCPACRRELEAIAKVVASLKALPEVPTRDFADAIEARILSQSAAAISPSDSHSEVQPEVVTAPVAGQSRPALSLVSNKDNVRSITTAPRRSRLLAVAAAAVLLVGVLAMSALAPKSPSEIASVPVAPVSDIQTASSSGSSEKSISPLSEDVVALYDEEGGNNVSDVGISTNEDGLYAIKM